MGLWVGRGNLLCAVSLFCSFLVGVLVWLLSVNVFLRCIQSIKIALVPKAFSQYISDVSILPKWGPD